MHRSFIVLFIFLVSASHAQESGTYAIEGAVSSLQQQVLSGDSFLLRSMNHYNTRDEDKTPGTKPELSKHRTDSLKDLLDKNKLSVALISDSLQNILNLPQDKVDQDIITVQLEADSLVHKIIRPGDDISNEIGETRQSALNEVNHLQGKVKGKTEGIEDHLQKGLPRVPDPEMNLPVHNLEVPDLVVKLPSKDQDIDQGKLEIPGIDPILPSLTIPGTEDLKISDVDLDMEALSEKADLDVPDMDKVKSLSGKINELDGKLVEVQQYEEELQNIKEKGIGEAEKLPEGIENEVENIDEIKAVNSGKQKATEYQDIIQRYKDQKLIHEEIKRKAKLVANEKLNKLSPAVKNAQQQIAKAKKLNPLVQSFKDIVKKRPNELKGKPFRQRFVPGMTLQTYNNDKFSFDWAVQAGYRITGRLTTGLGYTYRLSVDKTNMNWVAGEGLSGYRFYVDFRLIKSFYAHGEFEALTVDILKQPVQIETLRSDVYGSYFGLGKRYSISKKIKGSVTGLYRVDYQGSVPGLSKVNLRVGFDLNLTKEKGKRFIPK